MDSTAIFTIHRISVPVKKLNEPFYLIPFGDIHRSSDLCHVEKWHEFLDWAKGKPRTMFMGMGDYDDLASASERKMLTSSDLHDSTTRTLEQLYDKHTERLFKEIAFMDGNCVGLMEGNHYGQYSNATTTTQKLAGMLHCKYLGTMTIVRLAFAHGPREYCVDVVAHHGKGAARLIGGSLNRVQQLAEAVEGDIYLMGHDHRKSVGMVNRLRLSGGNGTLRLSHRKVLVGRTGSFLKGFEENVPSYVVDRCLNPTDLGVLKLELTPKRDQTKHGEAKREDRFYVDIHASI